MTAKRNPFIAKLVATGRIDPDRAQRIEREMREHEDQQPQHDEPATVGQVLAEAQQVAQQRGPAPMTPPPSPEALQAALRRAAAMLQRHEPTLRLIERRGREGEAAGPGAFVSLMIAIAWLYRASERQAIVDVFAVQLALADALGVSERTLRRWQARADVRRWIGAQPWYGEIGGERRRGGMIYSVRIRRRSVQRTPRPYRGIARLPWRVLERDIAEGTTYSANREQMAGAFFVRIQEGTFNAWPWITPVNPDTLSRITQNQDVNTIRTKNRAAWVRRFAETVARALRDGASRPFWQRLAWAIVRENAYTGNSRLATALAAAWREAAAGWDRLRSPAAAIVAGIDRRLRAETGQSLRQRLEELAALKVGREVAA